MRAATWGLPALTTRAAEPRGVITHEAVTLTPDAALLHGCME
jgi:hypothetical protein